MTTRDVRSLPPEAQEDIRKKAVKAVGEGEAVDRVAELFGVSRQAVYNWLEAYEKGGEKALQAKKKGRPKGGKLLPWQQAQIAKVVVHHHPEQMRLPGFLWTRDAVGGLIAQRFGVKMHRTNVGRYLNKWGFTPQKPVRRAYEQNPEAVSQWLNETYPAIRREAKAEGAEIHWEDESGLRSDDAVGRSYGKRGRTPVIRATGKRFGCSMISTVTNLGTLRFMVYTCRFNGGLFLKFLERLLKTVDKKVYLIVDGHPVHKAKKVQRWIQQNEDRIKLFRLPGYSPELNPDELLNQDVKNHFAQKERSRSQKEMVCKTRSFLRHRQQDPQTVKAYFRDAHVRYAS